jgi:CRP-like cAMP-binding protein
MNMKKHQPVLEQLFKVVDSYLAQQPGYYQYLTDHLQPQFFARDTPLYEKGDVVKKAWFLSSGFGMAYFYHDSGDRQVIRLYTGGALIGGKSFIEQTSSEEYLMACRGSYWMSLTHAEVDEIYILFPDVQEQSRLIMARRELEELEYKKLLALNGTERVKSFYIKYPDLLKPGKILRDADIASYLLLNKSRLRAIRSKLLSDGRL